MYEDVNRRITLMKETPKVIDLRKNTMVFGVLKDGKTFLLGENIYLKLPLLYDNLIEQETERFNVFNLKYGTSSYTGEFTEIQPIEIGLVFTKKSYNLRNTSINHLLSGELINFGEDLYFVLPEGLYTCDRERVNVFNINKGELGFIGEEYEVIRIRSFDLVIKDNFR